MTDVDPVRMATSHLPPLTGVGSPVATPKTPAAAPSLASGVPGLDHHGDQEVGAGLVDLAVNVRFPRPPDWLAQLITKEIGGLGAYPDATKARDAIAARHGVSADMVLPTNGGAEAFTLIAQGIDGRNPLVIHPQFTEPEAALRRVGRIPERHLLQAADDFALNPAVVSAAADLVMVGNPTNPTSVLHRRDRLDELRRGGRTVVVDEAFGDAVPGEPETMISAKMDGLLVVRSLTKTWGLAGLRAGYVVGDPPLIARLAALQSPWSVSSLSASVMVATATPDALAEAERGAMQQRAWREALVAGLSDLGLRPIPGVAPFVLVQVGAGVRSELRAAGFAVRRCDTFPGLDDTWVRIAARSAEAVASLLRHLAPLVARAVIPRDGLKT
ncbi:MAG: Rv2231c family pyridoxal phosphate-dependent protein CobC [Ornithinimicrobium sp.]